MSESHTKSFHAHPYKQERRLKAPVPVDRAFNQRVKIKEE